MPQTHSEWTLEMVHALPDDGMRYELVDGELLVSPAPTARHQRVLSRLYDVLKPYVASLGGYELFWAPIAVTFSRRRELQPDLSVWPLMPDGLGATQFEDVGRLLLAIEALSPSTTGNDRLKKRPVYQQEGVPETWIVDPAGCTVERWRTLDIAPEVMGSVMHWQPFQEVPALTIDLDAIFAP